MFGSLAAATYTVTVTDSHGCSTTTSVVITQPTVLTLAEATGSHVNVTCNGQSNGSFTVTAGGGTPAYSFNDGFATNGTGVFGSLAAATYTVTVTDSPGCSTTTSVVITQPTGHTNYLQTIFNGIKSNRYAKKTNGNYSSLIYILKHT